MRPPKKIVDFLRWFCREDYIEEIEGDLTEIFAKEYENSSRLSKLKFTLRVIQYLRPGFIKSMKSYPENTFIMYASYFRVGWRSLVKNRGISLINLVGLTLGLSICFTLLTIVNYEFGFDAFHPSHDKLFRVLGEVSENTGDTLTFCRVPYATVEITKQSSSIETATAVIPFNAKIKIPHANGYFNEFDSRLPDFHFITTAITEADYFQLFAYEWLAGNSSTALESPNSVVVTESRAKLYFNELEPYQLLGKSIVYDDSLIVQVTGVVKDLDDRSDLKFTDFISSASLSNNVLKKRIRTEGWSRPDMNTWVFVKLRDTGSRQTVEGQLNTMLLKRKQKDLQLALSIESISDMHFNSTIIENPIRTAHLPTLYALLGIGILILVLAIMNFVNINIALYLRHLKEAAVRKIIGSNNQHLVMRFLSENVIILLMASILSLCAIRPVLDIFKSYLPDNINEHWFQANTFLWPSTIFIAVVALLAIVAYGTLQSVSPANAMKGIRTDSGEPRFSSQKMLIVIQFSISVTFIIGSFVIERQIRFIRNKDLGFETNAIVALLAPRGEANKLKVFDTDIRKNSHVLNASLQWQSPIHENPRGMSLKNNLAETTELSVTQIAGDENYIPLYAIKILGGRNLTSSDTVREFVINETLMKKIGIREPSEALGKFLYWNNKPYPVVGVVEDFHTLNLHQPIEPVCIINRAERHGEIAVKLRGTTLSELKTGIEQIERSWRTVFGSAEFEVKFLDDSIAELYSKEEQTATLMNISTTVAILISCIGLIGLVTFMIEGRIKEIGIRKVLGASVAGIVSLFLGRFVRLIVISVIFASPVAYYFIDQWLNQFVYHVKLDWWIFVASGLLITLIAIVTVGFRTIKAALENPVNSLRSE